MALENLCDRVIETDVLVIGGGMAGSFAAIKATEKGARVVVWEKAVVQRSGGASGDPLHWHGVPARLEDREMMETLAKAGGRGFAAANKLDGLIDKNFNAVLNRYAWDRIHDLENWGINMRWDDGEYNILPDPMTGLPTEMRIRPKGMKKKLFEQLLKSEVELLERTMGIDLLTQDGAVVGATALNIRTGQFIICKSKAVVLATTAPTRTHHQYQGPAVGMYKMIYDNPPCAGDGAAMAIRSGAELVNMELPKRDRALMYEFDKFNGKIGALNQVQPKVPIVNSKGEKVSETSIRLHQLLKEEEAGKTPCYLDATGLPEEALRFLEEARYDEFPLAGRMHKVRGLDWRTDKYEISDYFPYEISTNSGILVDVDTKTRVKGLFAAGICAGAGARTGAMSGSIVFGAIAGENAVAYAAETGEPKVDESQVQAQKEPVFAPIKKGYGVPPLELEMKVRDIMFKYCGVSRNEEKINQGLWRLRSVRDKFLPEMVARTPHELMTCQEIRNLYLLGEVMLVCSRERKEGGVGYYRKDYPELADAPFEVAIIARLEDGEIKLSRKKLPELREEFKK